MEMTSDLAYFLGLWIAEGSIEEKLGRITITCGDNEVGEVLASGAILGIKFKNSESRRDQWRANSYALVEAMRYLEMPLVKAPQKWLPAFLWTGKREWAQHVLSGMFDGDGCIHRGKNKAGYTTASPQLADDVQLLLANFGIISRVSCVTSLPTKRVKVESDQYRVELFGKNVSILKSVLLLRIRRKAVLLESVSDDLFSRRDGVPILSILIEFKRLLPRIKRIILERTISIATRAGSDTTYETIAAILNESPELASSAPALNLKSILNDHHYWDEVSAIS